jgi:hypothetical protein
MASAEYIVDEFIHLAPVPLQEENYPYGFDMKIKSDRGETRWLKLTAAQVRLIEQVMLELVK